MQAYVGSTKLCFTNVSIFYKILTVFDPVNEGLSSAISEFGKHINYILVKVQSRSSLAKILGMSSDKAVPKLTFYTQRTKKSFIFKGFQWNCDNDPLATFQSQRNYKLDWILQVRGNDTAICHRGIWM